MTELLIDTLADSLISGLLQGWTAWPDKHIMNDNGIAVPFHAGQTHAWDSERRIVAVIAGSQGGKALACDTLIPTPDGFVLMGELKVEDRVFDDAGKVCRITFITPFMYNHACYRVVFDEGSSIIADGEHRWKTQTHAQRKNEKRRVRKPNTEFVKNKPQCQPGPTSSVVTTEEILDTLHCRRGAANHSIPLAGAIEYPEAKLPIPPYVFGAWLGDGAADGAKFYCADKEIVEEIRLEGINVPEGKYVPNQGKALTYVLGAKDIERDFETGQFRSGGSLRAALLNLGVLGNKHIPDSYLRSSPEQRLSLLQGLMDTDGYCDIRVGKCEFTSVNLVLAEDVLEIACSLSIKARLAEGKAMLNGKDCGPKYRVTFTTDVAVFRLSRKLKRLQAHKRKPNIKNRYVRAVEKVESVPVRCIQVDSPSHLYLASKSFIPTHNTAWGPWWLAREIERLGGGDYLAITSSYDLFKLKMLPALLGVFEGILGIGKYWGGDRLIEIAHPTQGFGATHSHDHDKMYGRIILRSAQAGRTRGQVAVSGLEATTARAAWLDEAGQEGFDLAAWRSILRRLSLAEGRILITTTLYNLGWLKREVMDKADESGKKNLESGERGELEITDCEEENICLIQYDSTINPAYPLAEFERAKADLPLDEFQMFYRGRIARLRHLVYDVFDRKKHTIPRFAIPIEWKRYVGLDFGAINTAALFYAKDPKGDWYCYREYKAGNRTADGHAAHITMGEPRLPICYGGSASEKQWRREFAAAGLPVRTPRISNVGVAINMVYAAHKRDQIIYFDDLDGIFEEKERYRWRRDREGNRTEEIEGKSSFHRLDAERYVLSSVLGGRGVYFG